MKNKIDIEKLICFLMSDEVIENNIPMSLSLGLKEQGLKVENRKICSITEPAVDTHSQHSGLWHDVSEEPNE